jgi:hypothetical protein
MKMDQPGTVKGGHHTEGKIMRRMPVVVGVLILTACDNGAQDPTSATHDANDFTATTTSSDLRCRGTVTGTFQDVIVPAGATCTIQGSTVNGNVLARERSRLFISATRVAGNIDGVAASVVQVKGGSVGGNIEVGDGSSPGEVGVAVYAGTVLTRGDLRVRRMNTGEIRIADIRLRNGSITVEENFVSSSLRVVRNFVAKDVTVRRNRGAGQKIVRNNEVLQTIKCEENAPPFVGGPNQAARAEGQCFRS